MAPLAFPPPALTSAHAHAHTHTHTHTHTQVVACASSNWAENVNRIESLTTEINSYREKEKQLQGGLFQSEGSRIEDRAPDGDAGGGKRKLESISDGGGGGGNGAVDIWGEFQNMIMSSGGNVGNDGGQGGGGGGNGFNINTLR